MKICNTCGGEKPINEFFKSSARKDGYEHRCKECKIAVNRASYLRNKDAIRYRGVKRRYKIDEDAYLEMISNGCEVCGSFENLCIDHDHKCCDTNITCGKCIRGILCKRCNIAEGLYKNDPHFIQNLIKYMNKHGII